MTPFELLILSIGLSMDVFAISISNGLTYLGLNLKKKILITIVFGIFHFLMLYFGFIAGDLVIQFISKFDHWIALGLLLYVGGEMIFDFIKDYKEYKKEKGEKVQKKIEFTTKTLFLQGLAVSVDAIAVGLSLSTTNIHILSAASCVGIVSMLFCMFGFFIGKKLGSILKHWAQLLGGIILIGIGIKIFLEHMII